MGKKLKPLAAPLIIKKLNGKLRIQDENQFQ